jgi:hypothetical protein
MSDAPRDDEDGEIAALVGDRSPGLRLSYLSQLRSRGLPRERASPLHSGAPLECRGRVELGLRLHAPSASLRTINFTGIRVPRITGLPSRHRTCTYHCKLAVRRKLLLFLWWKGRDSNPRPRHYEERA